MDKELFGTRSCGLARLQAFVPAMGRRYAKGRNYDHGPARHNEVSVLSPYIRRRLVIEQEVVVAALAAHGPEAAEKFVEEVIWRGYFKGWLERRPQVWTSYREGLASDLALLDRDPRLRDDVERATGGETGLDCFDAWARELAETGYLHNHARVWFASIWIFTLGLPWRLGADLFHRHLHDGDAASNTLGWRWVAGLHTRGKPYRARPSNITTFTCGRFAPRDGDPAEVAQRLQATEPDGLTPALPPRPVTTPQPGRPTALLITDEDCRIEEFDLGGLDIRPAATATVRVPARFVTRDDPGDPLARIAQDSGKPGRSSGAAVSSVAQAGPGLGVEHLEADPADLAAVMLPLLCDRLGVSSATVAHAAAHRWRYARVSAPLGQPFLRDLEATLHLGGDWSGGPRVEAAWTSGAAIADDLPGAAR